MKKIAFHDNILSIRGTTVAIYDYAINLKEKFGYECIILYDINYQMNNDDVKKKFLKHFKVFGYSHRDEIDTILSENSIDYFFAIKSGQNDGIVSRNCKNLIMAVSSRVTKEDVHGDKYFVCSPWLSRVTGIDYVPHMISLPEVDGDLRNDLDIPRDAIVFGRNGGSDTFDLSFVKETISLVLSKKENYYFLFQNTDKFIEHPRVIFIEPNPDLIYKVKFINTCDAHLHARYIGESFGLTCGEFSIKNKPVITWNGSPERNHIETLGEKAFLYNNKEDLLKLLLEFEIKNSQDWNCYKGFLPETVMKRFKNLYLDEWEA